MPADLYHITRVRDARSIARDGLLRRSESPAEKRAYEVGGEPDDMMMLEEPADIRADRIFDEIIADAKRAVDGAKQYPPHEDAVFFWTTKQRAICAEDKTAWTGVIVAVDRSRLPEGCRAARGDIRTADAIWNSLYAELRNRGRADRDELYADAKQFWRGVSWYEGNASRTDEVWVGCDVPPDAIVRIERADSGRVLYEPADADQQTLDAFAAGGGGQ